MAAPIGVALLGRLEAAHRDNPPERPPMPGRATFTAAYTGPGEPDYGPVRIPWEVPLDSEPRAVADAVAAVETMSFGDLIALAVDVGRTSAGAWSPTAPFELASAYDDAEARRPIAEALVDRFATQLVAPIDLSAQEYWFTPEARWNPTPFDNFEHVYCCGEFTWAALRTATSPPPEAIDALVCAWEMDDRGVAREPKPARQEARVWEIHRPQDWVELVESYPKVAPRGHDGWELPGLNQRDIPRELLASPNQHAVRTSVERVVMPDWRAVAADYDGVHLSWAGWLTSEGFVSDLPSGGVTMLRYWHSEHTHWLKDVLV